MNAQQKYDAQQLKLAERRARERDRDAARTEREAAKRRAARAKVLEDISALSVSFAVEVKRLTQRAADAGVGHEEAVLAMVRGMGGLL